MQRGGCLDGHLDAIARRLSWRFHRALWRRGRLSASWTVNALRHRDKSTNEPRVLVGRSLNERSDMEPRGGLIMAGSVALEPESALAAVSGDATPRTAAVLYFPEAAALYVI